MFRLLSSLALILTLFHLTNLAVGEEDAARWLTPVEIHTEGLSPTPKEHSNAGSLTLSPDGRSLFATSFRSRTEELLIYRRMNDDEHLNLVRRLAGAGGKPAFTSDSRFVYVPLVGMALGVHKIAEGDDAPLVDIQQLREGKDGILGMAGRQPLLIPPDDRHLYVASYQDQTLVCFERDLATGVLTFSECYQDDSAAVPVAGAPRAIARLVPTAIKTDGVGLISCLASAPDGKQIFAGVTEEDRLAIFDRDPNTGRLMLSTTVREEPHRFGNGVKGVKSIAFAGKGKFVVTASVTGGVSLFTRDPALREPIFERVFYGDIPGLQADPSVPKLTVVKGLINPVAVAFLPNETGLIVASARDHALHAFRFDPKIPALKWVGCARDGENGITGLHKVRDLAISPDGKYLYASSANATVAVFEIKF
jgi:6-phosphogluconolactonase (cycloisomerase 2 family)